MSETAKVPSLEATSAKLHLVLSDLMDADWKKGRSVIIRAVAALNVVADELEAFIAADNDSSAQCGGASPSAAPPAGETREADSLLEYLEDWMGLHRSVEIFYVVDGYRVELTSDDGNTVAHTGEGPSLLRALQNLAAAPREATPNE